MNVSKFASMSYKINILGPVLRPGTNHYPVYHRYKENLSILCELLITTKTPTVKLNKSNICICLCCLAVVNQEFNFLFVYSHLLETLELTKTFQVIFWVIGDKDIHFKLPIDGKNP